MYTPNLSYTYPGKINTELIQKPKIQTPALTELFTIRQGIRCGEYINLVQPLTSVLTKGTADCAPVYTQSGSITDRKLETGLFEINLSVKKKNYPTEGGRYRVPGLLPVQSCAHLEGCYQQAPRSMNQRRQRTL